MMILYFFVLLIFGKMRVKAEMESFFLYALLYCHFYAEFVKARFLLIQRLCVLMIRCKYYVLVFCIVDVVIFLMQNLYCCYFVDFCCCAMFCNRCFENFLLLVKQKVC